MWNTPSGYQIFPEERAYGEPRPHRTVKFRLFPRGRLIPKFAHYFGLSVIYSLPCVYIYVSVLKYKFHYLLCS